MSIKMIMICLAVVLVLCFVCSVSVYFDPEFQFELAAQNAQTSSGEITELPVITAEDVETYVPAIGYFLLFVFLVWAVKKIIDASLAVPIFIIICGVAIILFVGYLFAYGDKNGDGQGDAQIIKVIQPTGENPDIDEQYSKINEQNAKTNAWSALSIIGYSAMLLISFVVLTGLGIVLHYIKR